MDDAGTFLYAMAYFDPAVISAVKFLQVARSHISGVILTTPSRGLIISKILEIEGCTSGN
jgi:hypothetical protein